MTDSSALSRRLLYRSVDQIAEIVNGVECDDVAIVGAFRAAVAGTRENVKVVAVDNHGRIMARLARIVGLRHEACKAPIGAISGKV